LSDGEHDQKDRPLPGRASRRDTAAVPFHDLAADGQADACALILAAPVQALEWGEDTVEVLFIKPNAIILYVELAHRWGCVFSAARLLPGQ